MSIADQITRIKNNIAASYAECSAKGATLPATENSENLPNTIASITTGGGAGGDSITYTNITGATIAKDDKLWINTTATTTEKASVQLGVSNAYVIQTSNPNVAITTNELYTLQNGAYVFSSFTKVITMDNVGIDKNGLLFSSNTLYNIENNIFYNDSFESYVGNGYVYYNNKIFKVDVANPANVITTYSGPSSNQMVNGWCFEDDVIIGLHAYNKDCYVYKLNSDGTGFNKLKSLSLGAIVPIGQFSEQKIGWGLKGNSYKDLNLGAYRYSRNGDDVNVEEIPATEFPEDMRPMFTEQPSYVFWNEQTLTLTASWASTTPNKVLIFKYINGEWVNKTPIINEFVSDLGYITCDSSVSKIIVSGTAFPSTQIIYDGNEKSGGYYGVPYLYSNKNTITAKADEECVNNATSTASTVLFGGAVTPPSPEPSTKVDPSKLKFGDRIDNKATVVGTFESSDLGTVVFAVLDARYRGNVGHTMVFEKKEFGLPRYMSQDAALNAKESATYNTNYIIYKYNLAGKNDPFVFVRNIFVGDTQCQLPNLYELQQIYKNREQLDALDPTVNENPTKTLSKWIFSDNTYGAAWSSTEGHGYGEDADIDGCFWVITNIEKYLGFSADSSNHIGVIPIIEIPVDKTIVPPIVLS